MLGLTNIGNEGQGNTPIAQPCLVAIHEIHVLLADHEPDGLLSTRQMLEPCRYRVTLVDLASTAMTMLLTSKTKFDVVIANINSPDHLCHKLLELSVSKNIPIVVLSYDENMFTTIRALKSGALLCVQKPVSMEVLKYLWQHVMRQKTWSNQRESLYVPTLNNNVELTEMVGHFNRTLRLEGTNNINNNAVTNRNIGSYRGKRRPTIWTNEKHSKFVDAVKTLGQGKCFPKEILKLMNVPGLTKLQVASHLQECRHNHNWRLPEERMNQLAIQSRPSDFTSKAPPQAQSRMRFGSMPKFIRRSSSPQTTGENPPTHTEPNEPGLQNLIGSGPMNVEANSGVVALNNALKFPQIPEMNMRTHVASMTHQNSSNPSQAEPDEPWLQSIIAGGPMNVVANDGGAYNYGPLVSRQMNITTHCASVTHQLYLLNPDKFRLQSTIGSGFVNMAANGGVGDCNYEPLVPHQMNIDQHSLNRILTSDGDFFNFPDIESVIQNYSNSVLQASEGFNTNVGFGCPYDPFNPNQNANDPGNK